MPSACTASVPTIAVWGRVAGCLWGVLFVCGHGAAYPGYVAVPLSTLHNGGSMFFLGNPVTEALAHIVQVIGWLV